MLLWPLLVAADVMKSPEEGKCNREYLQNQFELGQVTWQASYTHACHTCYYQFGDTGLKKYFFGDFTWNYSFVIRLLVNITLISLPEPFK